MVKVEIDLPKEQYNFINKILEQNPWLGNLDDFIRTGIREYQEHLMESMALGRMKKAVEHDIEATLKRHPYILAVVSPVRQ